MPGSRHKILGHVFSGFCQKMNRTKEMNAGSDMETPLKRCLNTFDITLLGVGHMVGAGIYVLTGTVARELAGPGIVLSFILAGMTSMLAALCYAEFGTRIPKAGSAYVYTYVSIGEFWAFVIGWNIILEHMIGAASVARAWSGYVDSLLGGAISNATVSVLGEMHEQLLGKYPDILAFLVCISYAAVLGTGVKGSALVNSVLTVVNLGVMALVVGVGFWYADPTNWALPNKGFLPYGMSGVIAGAATCFYAFVGFDSIATSGEEARDPTYSIPLATILSMTLVCIGYMLVSGALTLMVPYSSISLTAALPEALSAVGLPWAKYVVSVGALCGMTTTLLGSLFSLPRCMYSMAADGLIFSFLGRVNKTTQVPMINLAVSGLCSATIALLFDLEKLVEFMSIGTLLAYTIVSASVIILRYRPDLTPLLRDDSSEPTTPISPSGVYPITKFKITMDNLGTPAYNTRSKSVGVTILEKEVVPPSEAETITGPMGHSTHIEIQDESFTESEESVDVSANTHLNSIIQGIDDMVQNPDNESREWRLGPGGRLKAGWSWLEPVVGNCPPGSAVSASVFIFVCFSAALCFHLHWAAKDLGSGTWWTLFLTAFLIATMFGCLVVIEGHEQNTNALRFKVPLVPFVPALSILCNIELMAHLNVLTWLRFMIWMALGLLVYFLYGIHHSKENDGSNSYSVLLTSSETGKLHWGAISKRKHSTDTLPIVEREELPE